VLGGRGVPLRREQKIDGLTGRVHGAVQIFVFTLDLDIGLVGAIARVGGFQMGSAALVQVEWIGLDPAPDAGGVNGDATFRQQLGTCS